MKKQCFLILMGLSIFSSAQAVDLFTVYRQALESDPVLQQADANRKANKEAVPQSVAGLLPALSSSANTTDTRISQQGGSFSSNGFSAAGNQHSYELSLQQPLFNFQSWMQLRAANNSSKQADATYNAALQDLIIRVSTAYFTVLEAQDNLRFISAQKKAVGDQLKQIKDRYEVGMATMTDVYQAQANYDSLNAQEISAQNNIMNSFESLRQITGRTYNQLDLLQDKLPLANPHPENAALWIHAGEHNNWTLIASHYAEQAAKENIRVNYAGHFPTVNAVGQYQNGNGPALGMSTPSNAWSSNVGLQLNVPLFQGGAVVSKTRQAQDQYLSASDQMEITHRQVILQAQEAYNNVMAGISKVEADRIAVTSAKSALESTDAGYKAGTKTILDVLTAQQNLFQSQATLSSDQYSYILSTLALKQAAGSLNAGDVIAINRLLKHPEKLT
jgi:outer membrane protein